jgi:hypothetical protein
MIYEIQCRSLTRRYFLERLIVSFINQLNLQKSKKSVLVTLKSDCPESGLTVEIPQINSYLIVIKSSISHKEMGITLAHEMVHVNQLARSILKTGTKGAKYWKGKYFPSDANYTDLPWEIQAFQRQEIMFRRAIET